MYFYSVSTGIALFCLSWEVGGMEEHVQALKSDCGALPKWPHFFTPLALPGFVHVAFFANGMLAWMM